MSRKNRKRVGFCLVLGCLFAVNTVAQKAWGEQEMWERAKGYEKVFRFSTLFIAQDVRDHLSSESGLKDAIRWCRDHGVTRVFIETFRDGYTADKRLLTQARDTFRKEGFAVSGCVTPTGMGVASTGWDSVSNYEDPATREECRRVFEYSASLFDEIMIDDFLFTDDESELSVNARGDRSWSDYRSELMLRVSRESILAPARQANPNVELIIKFPQWYDNFHNRGYNVVTETDAYDRIWVGTETRDPDSKQWGRKAQYEAFYIMRWLTDIGREKTGGGWFDPYGTGPQTYVEQARQTILGGAREAMLFHYGSLLGEEAAKNTAALRREMPSLFLLAEAVAEAHPVGILAPKIPNSDAPKEMYIYDFLGMLGLPLVPLSRIDTSYPAALFATQSWSEGLFADPFREFLEENKPVAVTHHLRDLLKEKGIAVPGSVQVIDIPEDPRALYEQTAEQLLPLRTFLLEPLGLHVSGPSRVALYLFDNGTLAVENFRDESVDFTIHLKKSMHEIEENHARKTFFALPEANSAAVEISSYDLIFRLEPRALGVVKVGEGRW